MAYLALYRAWRPQKFAEVIGQEHITRTLVNSLEQRRFSHAYLFAGPRGSGKTSVAKIMAKAVNCQNSVGGEPCNECDSCIAITKGSLLDVIEIDAASNRGVDEIRELRENVKFTPTEVKYKVYIIDEVHMLTTEAFNALLKTLEEPPEHVVFILATTEAHKLPLTIISRCQRFDFRRISATEMIGRMQEIVVAEGYTAEPEALMLVARYSEGAMRDALGLLDQAFAMVTDSKKILTDDVLLLTGRISTQEFSEITKQIRAGQTDQVLTQTNQLLQQGKEPQRILEDLIFYYRDLLLYKTAPGLEEIKAKIIADKEFTAAADSYTDEQLYLMIETLNKYLSELRFTAQNRIVLELALIRASRMFVKQGQPATTVEPVAKVEPTATEQKAPVTAAKPEAVPEAKPEVAAKTAPRVANGNGTIPNNMELSTYEKLCDLANAADDDEIWRIKEEWNAVLATLRQRKINVHAWFIDGEPVCVADKRIVVAFKSLMHRDTSNKLENLQLIEEVVEQNLASPYKVVNVMLRDWQQIVEPPQVEKKPQEKSADELVADTISLFGEDILEIKGGD
jgi:DNA polymerase-3 subunit gamma/tau